MLLLMEAVSNNGLALQFAHDSLKDDYHVVYAAITSQPLAFQLASERMQASGQCGQWTLVLPKFPGRGSQQRHYFVHSRALPGRTGHGLPRGQTPQ